MRGFLTVAAACALSASANAQIQSIYDFELFGVGAMKNLSHTNFAPAFSSPGDGFGVFQRGVSATLPFSLMDDSAIAGSIGGFAADSLGIVSNWHAFFGATDTINSNNPSGPVTADRKRCVVS